MGRLADALWRAYGAVVQAQAQLYAEAAELARARG